MEYVLRDHPEVMEHFDPDLLYGFDLCVTELTMENFMRCVPPPLDLVVDTGAKDYAFMRVFLDKYKAACVSRNQRSKGLLDSLKKEKPIKEL